MHLLPVRRASVSQTVSLVPAMPALLTRMSILPSAFSVASRACSTAAKSETSTCERDNACADLLCGLFGQRPVMIPDRDLGAGSDEALGHRAAEALRAAGDHRAAAVQIDLVHGDTLSFWWSSWLGARSRARLKPCGPVAHPLRRGSKGRSSRMRSFRGAYSVQPPSMMWATPVVKALSSLAR